MERLLLVFDGLPVGVRGEGCARAVARSRLLTLGQAVRLAMAPVKTDADGIPIARGYPPAPVPSGAPVPDPEKAE